MKIRRFVVLLFICLVVFSSIVYGKEATFRDIPYGISYSDFKKTDYDWLRTGAITYATQVHEKTDSVETIYSLFELKPKDYDVTYIPNGKKAGCSISYVMDDSLKVKLGGYDITELTLYFAPFGCKTEEELFNKDEYSFYMGVYCIRERQDNDLGLKDIYVDLSRKLYELYGDSVYDSNSCNYWTDEMGNYVGIMLKGKNIKVVYMGKDAMGNIADLNEFINTYRYNDYEGL